MSIPRALLRASYEHGKSFYEHTAKKALTMNPLPPNSKDCVYGGYKLSSIVPKIAFNSFISKEIQLNIGCEDDDQFYSDSGRDGRVEIMIQLEGDIVTVDLEQVLEFAKTYCPGIFERVYRNYSIDTS